MKNYNYLSFFLFSIIIIHLNELGYSNQVKSIIKSKNSSTTFYCLIQNSNYLNEYLYSSFEHQINPEDIKEKNFKHKVFTNHIHSLYSKHINQYIWVLKPVEWLNDTFYMTNFYFNNQHLCSSHNHVDSLNHRRQVLLNKLNKESLMTNKKCMWIIRSISSKDSSLVEIWNNYYKEPFYAASNLFRSGILNRRNVFLWYDQPDSKQFSWKLLCLK
jgi:hypothetical protein